MTAAAQIKNILEFKKQYAIKILKDSYANMQWVYNFDYQRQPLLKCQSKNKKIKIMYSLNNDFYFRLDSIENILTFYLASDNEAFVLAQTYMHDFMKSSLGISSQKEII